MPVPVTCPHCQAAARVPEELLGKTVRCPGCLTTFTAPAAAAPPPRLAPEEPPEVTLAPDGPDEHVVVVRVRRPAPPRPRREPRPERPPPEKSSNVGVWIAVVVGGLMLLGVGLFIAVYVLLPVGRGRGRAFTPPRTMAKPAMPPAPPNFGNPGMGIPGPAGAPAEFRSDPRVKELADIVVPDAREVKQNVAGPRRQLTGATITPVQLDAAPAPLPPRGAGRGRYAGVCWSADGSSFFVLATDGTLRRVSFPDFEEQRRLDLGQTCSHLALCGEGLLVVMPELREMWVIDPEALAVRRRIGIERLAAAVTGPTLAVAYAFTEGPPGPANRVPARVDLAEGKVSGMTAAAQNADPAVSLIWNWTPQQPALSPDGRWLFALSNSKLVRFRVEGDRLTVEESSQPQPYGPRPSLVVSPDGRWVCALSSSGAGGGGAPVYRAEDLTQPAFTLPPQPWPRALGFDPAGKRIYVQGLPSALTAYDETGMRQMDLRIPDRRSIIEHEAQQLLAHPAGRGLLLLTRADLSWIEFPAP